MKKEEERTIKYTKMFWLFIIASYFGLLLEGLYCLFKFGKWESHVVSIYGHLCIIYGIGAVLYYIFNYIFKKQNFFLRFFIYACLGTFVELVAGLILEFGLGMYAWSYRNSFLNFRGHICLFMFIVWGLFGLFFEKCDPYVDKLLKFTRKKVCKIITPILSIILAIDFAFTGVCIYRWSERHYYELPSNALEKYIDKKYDDEYMSKRFMEWHFFDDSSLKSNNDKEKNKDVG